VFRRSKSRCSEISEKINLFHTLIDYSNWKMLTRGSLSLICEDLEDSEKIVACFAGLSHDVPKEMNTIEFCYSIPYFPIGHKLVDFVYELRQMGGLRSKVYQTIVSINLDEEILNVTVYDDYIHTSIIDKITGSISFFNCPIVDAKQYILNILNKKK